MSSTQDPGLWSDGVPNQSPALVVISVVFLLVSTAFFATRIVWRFKYRQRGWDDLMAAIAWVTLVVQTVFGGMSANYGFGKHKADIPQGFRRAMFYFYLYQNMYKILGTFTKLTFCFLYLRLFNHQQHFKKIVWTNIIIIAAGGIAFTAGTIWQCTPVRLAWDKSVRGWCTDNTSFWFSHAAFNTFMDIVVFVLPIPLITTLQMARKSKIGLISLFSLGAFTIAASIVRMVMLRGSAASVADPTWGSMKALIWTEIESNTSMICCCLPALRKLATTLWHRIRGVSLLSTPQPSAAIPGNTARGAHGGIFAGVPPDNPNRLGNHTDIRYSPPDSPIMPARKNSRRHAPAGSHSSTSMDATWLNQLLRPWGKRKQTTTAPPNAPNAFPMHDMPDRNQLAPKLELGNMYNDAGYTSQDVPDDYVPAWQPSARMSIGKPRDPQVKDASTAPLSDFVRESSPPGNDPFYVGKGTPRKR